jgi:hypothetical protein
MALSEATTREKTAHQSPQLIVKSVNRSKSYNNEEKEKQDEKQKGKETPGYAANPAGLNDEDSGSN